MILLSKINYLCIVLPGSSCSFFIFDMLYVYNISPGMNVDYLQLFFPIIPCLHTF